jgi:hypothetical protein
MGLAADLARQQRVQFLEFGELRRVGFRVHPLSTTTDRLRILCMCYIFAASVVGSCVGMIQRKKPLAIEETTNINAMKLSKKLSPQVRSRLSSVLMVAAMLLLNTLSAFAQGAGGFNSTDLKTGISNSLAVIMMFGFVLGISAVIYGGFAIRRGDVDQGKMSIIGGAIIAAAPAVVFAFYKIFGLDANSAVGVGNF